MPQPVTLLSDLLRELREERGLSRSQLSRLTVKEGYEGVPEATIRALEEKPGRVPAADTLQALASALGVDPGVFYEWPIALAKRDADAARGELLAPFTVSWVEDLDQPRNLVLVDPVTHAALAGAERDDAILWLAEEVRRRGGGGVPAPRGELGRRLRADRPSREGRPGSGSGRERDGQRDSGG